MGCTGCVQPMDFANLTVKTLYYLIVAAIRLYVEYP
jgi:hypothetical protein